MECGLHLHISGSLHIPPLYAPTNVPGLVIANGNVGPVLSDDIVDTWMSTDNGNTWNWLAKGVNIYEVSLSGDVVILASYGDITNTTMISYDSGAEWIEIKLEVFFKIINI